jgi:hypothetical protein
MNRSPPQKIIKKIISPLVQIAILLDTSKSMEPNKSKLINFLKGLTKFLSFCQTHQAEFSLVGYRDFNIDMEDEELSNMFFPDSNKSLNNDFTSSLPKQGKGGGKDYIIKMFGKGFVNGNSFKAMLGNGIKFVGGDDYPEAVLLGLMTCAEGLRWKSDAVKIVIHITDAPPHGNIYKPDYIPNGKNYKDNFPGGCPRGNSIHKVSREFRKKNIKYTLIECVDQEFENALRPMKYIFSSPLHFGQFQTYNVKKPYRVVNTIIDALDTGTSNQMKEFRELVRKMLERGQYDI